MNILPNRVKQLSAAGAVLLAVYLCIQVIFYKAPEYLGVAHPSQTMLLLVCACLCPTAIQLVVRKSYTTPWKGMMADIAIALFIAYAALRLLPYSGIHVTQDLTNLLSGGLIYSLGRLVGVRHTNIFVKSMLLCATLQTVLGAIYLLVSDFSSFEAQERVLLFADIMATQWPSISAGLIIVGMVVYALDTPRKLYIVLFTAFAGLLFWFPLLVGARSVVFSVALTLISVFLLRRASLKKKVFITALFILAALSGLSLLPEQRLAFFGQVTSFWRGSHEKVMIQRENKCVIKDNSVLIRRAMYQDAIDLFGSSPWIGIGTAQYGNHSCFFGFGAQKGGDSHSLILSIASELGVIGLTLWGVTVGWVITHASRLRQMQGNQFLYPAVAAWVFCVIYDQFNSSYVTSISFYLVTGYVVSALCSAKSFHHNGKLQCSSHH